MKCIPFLPAWWLNAVLMAAVLMFCACSRKPPLEEIVEASSDSRLMLWKASVAGDFTRQEWQDFEAAVQEIKYGVMIAGEASGSAGVWTATLQKLDGATVRQVLELGLGQKLRRITQERDKFVQYVTNNDRLRVAAGDEDSVEYLRNLREHQERRIALLTEQIKATQEILQRREIVLDNPTAETPKPGASEPF